jgi:hypothetical protein
MCKYPAVIVAPLVSEAFLQVFFNRPVVDVVLKEYILPKLQDTSQFLQESDRKSTYHSSNLANLLHVLIGPTDLIVKAYVQGKIPHITL